MSVRQTMSLMNYTVVFFNIAGNGMRVSCVPLFHYPAENYFHCKIIKLSVWGKALHCGMKFTRCYSLVLLLRLRVPIFTCGKRIPVQMVFLFISL
ncbi:MAG: hypothetical protein PF448_06485, partial [Bacteroidales bacterium]|nr:hypothetical protein [Bacteroidales bacterium]